MNKLARIKKIINLMQTIKILNTSLSNRCPLSLMAFIYRRVIA